MAKARPILFVLLALTACENSKKTMSMESSEMENWKLGWRMINSSWDSNYQLGEQQFDSLLSRSVNVQTNFLLTGFEILYNLDKKEKIKTILKSQDKEKLAEICNRQFFKKKFTDSESCKSLTNTESIENKELQRELIKMYVQDQAARGNVMKDVIANHNFSSEEISTDDAAAVDENNRNRLKVIISKHGFPTRGLVGREAMRGIFLMIQHADGDTEWQKAQLPLIEQAVRQGDMDGESYAYLYDRIKVNSGASQLYGTQFSKVDRENKVVELAATEDLENLDKRRMEMGMMPIEMYKRFMLKNL